MVARTDTELVDIVVPVHNEARTLEVTIARLRDYLDRSFPFPAVVTIADNASTDGTDVLARSLASRLDGVRALHLDEKGRGRALRASWIASRAKVVAYMDADLATVLEALLPLVAPLCPATATSRRYPYDRWRPRRPWPQTRAHLPVLQRASPRCTGQSLQRCPVRLQGDAS